MPIYEEKLICPLAVRFTQEHIRPKFKDRRQLEESIKQIQTKPGTEGYDCILEAPFPSIEIIRWSQFDAEASESDADHWFTLDNRRLYCLQRMAASMWPQKCAARVEVLYAASHGIKRKDTSMTVGRDVLIKHSDRYAVSADRWDWRATVHQGLETKLRRALRCVTEETLHSAHELVTSDDRKASTEELLDAPEAPSMLSSSKVERVQTDGASTGTGPSDVENDSEALSSPRSVSNTEEENARSCPDGTSATLSALRKALIGLWTGNKGESYEVKVTPASDTWNCSRWSADGACKSFTLWYDEGSNCISWGFDWNYFIDVSEFLVNPSKLQWYSGLASEKKPRFTWHNASNQAKAIARAATAAKGKTGRFYRPKA